MDPHFLSPGQVLPDWLPDRFRLYFAHILDGRSLRALARDRGLHASTVLRQVRRCEMSRDDPLLDRALARLAESCQSAPPAAASADRRALPMTPASGRLQITPAPGPLALAAGESAETLRILRRLAEPGALLAFAADMEKAAVLRDAGGGRSTRTAVLARELAESLCLRDWIACCKAGRISTYRITPAGRAALRRLSASASGSAQSGSAQSGAGQSGVAGPGFAEAAAGFSTPVMAGFSAGTGARALPGETPVAVLGRRREKNGSYFLTAELVSAAERLREDFELAQIGAAAAQDWQGFLAGAASGLTTDPAPSGAGCPGAGPAEAPERARARLAGALRELGPGLGDIALRVCCWLEGVESAEQSMGWAARSGKIVLRIALIRLRRHYDTTCGRGGPMIG